MRGKENSRTEAIAKGYRLKPETHKLVEKLQKKINGTKDDAINRACRMFYDEIIDSRKKRANSK